MEACASEAPFWNRVSQAFLVPMPTADANADAASSAVPVGACALLLQCFSFFSCGRLNSIWFSEILIQLLVNNLTGTFYKLNSELFGDRLVPFLENPPYLPGFWSMSGFGGGPEFPLGAWTLCPQCGLLCGIRPS